jgi:hypothetical protein
MMQNQALLTTEPAEEPVQRVGDNGNAEGQEHSPLKKRKIVEKPKSSLKTNMNTSRKTTDSQENEYKNTNSLAVAAPNNTGLNYDQIRSKSRSKQCII